MGKLHKLSEFSTCHDSGGRNVIFQSLYYSIFAIYISISWMSLGDVCPKNFGFLHTPLCVSPYPLWDSQGSPQSPSLPPYLSVSLSKVVKNSLICLLMCSLISTRLALRIFMIGAIFRFTAEPSVRGWGLESEVNAIRNGGPIPRNVFRSTFILCVL